MRLMRSITAATVAATLAVCIPVTAANAATRANAAVPTGVAVQGASSSAAAASDSWVLWLIAALDAALVVRVVTEYAKGNSSPVSRG